MSCGKILFELCKINFKARKGKFIKKRKINDIKNCFLDDDMLSSLNDKYRL